MIGKCGEDGVKNYWYWEFGSTTHINAAPMHTSESTVYSLQPDCSASLHQEQPILSPFYLFVYLDVSLGT